MRGRQYDDWRGETESGGYGGERRGAAWGQQDRERYGRDYGRGGFQRGALSRGRDYEQGAHDRGDEYASQWGRGQYGQYDRGGEQERRGFGERGQYGQSGSTMPIVTYTEMWMVVGPFTGRGPRGYRRSDDRIREDIHERLTQHGQVDASDIDVDVRDGDVTLRGMVDNRAMRRMAEDVVESVSGVQDVTNQIRVRRPVEGGGGDTGRDADWRRTSEQAQAGSGMTGADMRPRLRRGMEVMGSDGKRIGTVGQVRDQDFIVERPMQRDVPVPFSALKEVADDRATLNVPSDRVDDTSWSIPTAGTASTTGTGSASGMGSTATTGSSAGAVTSTPGTESGQRQQAARAGTATRSQTDGPGAQYGREMANDPRFRGREWKDAEPELQAGYADWARRQSGGSQSEDAKWEQLRQDVERAWEESRR